MKKIALFAFSCLLINSLFAQDSTVTPNVTPKKEPLSLAGRANDHFMIQLGYTGWAGKPDSINTGGFSKVSTFISCLIFPLKPIQN